MYTCMLMHEYNVQIMFTEQTLLRSKDYCKCILGLKLFYYIGIITIIVYIYRQTQILTK